MSTESEVLGSISSEDSVLLPSPTRGHLPGLLTHLACFLQSSLVAVVVPDADVLPSFAAKLGVKGSFEELCQNQVSLSQQSCMHPWARCGRGEAPPAQAPRSSRAFHLKDQAPPELVAGS